MPVCTCHTGGRSQSTEHLTLLAGVTHTPATDDGRSSTAARQRSHMSTEPAAASTAWSHVNRATFERRHRYGLWPLGTTPNTVLCYLLSPLCCCHHTKLRAPSCVGRRRSQTHVFGRHHRTHATLLLHASARVALRCHRCCPAAVAALPPLPSAAIAACCSYRSSRIAV